MPGGVLTATRNVVDNSSVAFLLPRVGREWCNYGKHASENTRRRGGTGNVKNGETAAKEKRARSDRALQTTIFNHPYVVLNDRGSWRILCSQDSDVRIEKRRRTLRMLVPRIIAIISREITGAKCGKLARCDATTKDRIRKGGGKARAARSTFTLYITPYNRILKLESSTDDPLRPTTTLIRT